MTSLNAQSKLEKIGIVEQRKDEIKNKRQRNVSRLKSNNSTYSTRKDESSEMPESQKSNNLSPVMIKN